MRTAAAMGALVLVVALATACDDDDPSGSDGGRADASGTGGAAGQGGTGPLVCPLPSQGPCPVGLICESGEDPRKECRARSSCLPDGTRQQSIPDCGALPTVACPASREAAAGNACGHTGAICVFEQGLQCRCTDCPRGAPVCGGGALAWDCDVPNPDPGCPAAPPRLGSSCTQPGKQCRYECGDEGARLCRDGVWFVADGGPCPISAREAKADIRYLDEQELRALGEQVLALRLARYRYRDPALRSQPGIGFIIEDSPELPAIDQKRRMVDVYAYASMMLAALKQQAGEIERLRARVGELERARPRRAR